MNGWTDGFGLTKGRNDGGRKGEREREREREERRKVGMDKWVGVYVGQE